MKPIDQLLTFFELNFNNRLYVRYISYKAIKNITFTVIYSNNMRISKTTKQPFHIFRNIALDSYKVEAQITFCDGRISQLITGNFVNPQPFFKITQLMLNNQFKFGEKYLQRHIIYDNVDDYRLEIGFDPNGGFEYNKHKFNWIIFKKCYDDLEPEDPNFDFLNNMYYVANLIPKDKFLELANIFDSCVKVLFTSITPLQINYYRGIEPKLVLPTNNDSSTPDFEPLQLYFKWLNVEKTNTNQQVVVQLSDHGFFYHEALQTNVVFLEKDGGNKHHGVASAGIIAAKKISGCGIMGISNNAILILRNSAFVYKFDIESCPGDIILLNLQLVIPNSFVELPIVSNLGIWIKINRAVENGRIIICPAGNAGLNLSHTPHFIDHGESGVIMVASTNYYTSSRLEYSNYNHPSIVINCHGSNIVTSGFGDLHFGNKYKTYTSKFEGTCASAAIACGVICNIYCEFLSLKIFPNSWEFIQFLKQNCSKLHLDSGVGVSLNFKSLLEKINLLKINISDGF